MIWWASLAAVVGFGGGYLIAEYLQQSTNSALSGSIKKAQLDALGLGDDA